MSFDKDAFHALIKEEKPWYRIPSMIHLYFLMIARVFLLRPCSVWLP